MTTTTIPARHSTTGGIAWGYLRVDLKRMYRNRRTLIFTVVMPAALYLLFGVSQHDRIGNGDIAFYVLVGMAVYGAMLAAATTASSVSVERQAGWIRTLMMTPLRPAGYIATKVLLALVVSALPVVVLAITGAVTTASAPVATWVACLLLAWLGSGVFAALGLAVGSAARSDGVTQILGGVLALLGFAGNVFVPLSGVMLDIARFTPMFGVSALARYPLDHGVTPSGDHTALWMILANVVVWATLFAVAAAGFQSRRGGRR